MPTDVVIQLRAYLDYASGESPEQTLIPSQPDKSSGRWYRKGPVLALLAGVVVLAVGIPALLSTSEPAPSNPPGRWSKVADLPMSISIGALVEPIVYGLVVVQTESTTIVSFDGTMTPGERPPVNVSPGCCGSAVAIPVGKQVVIFDSYAPGTWRLEPESVTWDQIGDRPSTGDVLGSAVIGDQIYVVTESPRAGSTNARVAVLDTTIWEWTELEPVPAVISVGGVTTDGERLIVAGVRQNGNNIIVGESRQPVAFSLEDGRWEALPDVPIDGQAATVAWVDHAGLLAWNYELDSVLLGEGGDWTSTGRVPMGFSECYPQTRRVDNGAVAFFCGQLAYFDATSRSWSSIPTKDEAAYAAVGNSVYELAPANDQTTLSVRSLSSGDQ